MANSSQKSHISYQESSDRKLLASLSTGVPNSRHNISLLLIDSERLIERGISTG